MEHAHCPPLLSSPALSVLRHCLPITASPLLSPYHCLPSNVPLSQPIFPCPLSTYPSTTRWIAKKKEIRQIKKGLRDAMSLAPTSLITVALSTYSYSTGDPSASLDVVGVFRPGVGEGVGEGDIGMRDGVYFSKVYRFSIGVK